MGSSARTEASQVEVPKQTQESFLFILLLLLIISQNESSRDWQWYEKPLRNHEIDRSN